MWRKGIILASKRCVRLSPLITALAIGELLVTRCLMALFAVVMLFTVVQYPTPAQRSPYFLHDCTATRRHPYLPLQERRAVLEEAISHVDA